ncbi:GAF and ANTAR domain-containing protein [Kutzneria sp. CA-103260]|uniref:GAF and ANTAR domain-containing protein n=1 Tax=Kutzneria sp. CA-103260 TaxID=2802641 RepID=UPI001BA90DBE|nr:GAF and ANTAR domain-containing protein [Kutzneria sp. CA-103260]QUQ65888.1 ANTAR domain-containing protein [Kutzneria sp. CA-103260]
MDSLDRRARQAFVLLTGRLVTNFDAIDYLCNLAHLGVDLLDVSVGGILLADRRRALRFVAASMEWSGVHDLWEPRGGGPSMDAFLGGSAVWSPDLATEDRWPDFTATARTAGFAAAHAFPMRVCGQAVGALSLLSAQPGKLDVEAAELAQTLADLATMAVLNERAGHRPTVGEQLGHVLNNRITIEQAKGVLAERLHVTIEDAFSVLRGYTRQHNLKLADVARAVARGDLRITSPEDGHVMPSAGSGHSGRRGTARWTAAR